MSNPSSPARSLAFDQGLLYRLDVLLLVLRCEYVEDWVPQLEPVHHPLRHNRRYLPGDLLSLRAVEGGAGNDLAQGCPLSQEHVANGREALLCAREALEKLPNLPDLLIALYCTPQVDLIAAILKSIWLL